MAGDPKRIKMIFRYMEHDRLNDWEENFVESVERQFRTKEELTDDQYKKLEEIYEKNS